MPRTMKVADACNRDVDVLLPEGAPFAGKTVRDLEQSGEGDVSVAAVIREKFRRYVPAAHWTLYAGDILVLRLRRPRLPTSCRRWAG